MIYLHPFVIWILILIAAMVASWRATPALVQGLANQAPFEYNALGCPDADDLFARFPNGLQLKFAWFVVSGRAYAVTHGSARAAAVWAWLGYVVTATALPASFWSMQMLR